MRIWHDDPARELYSISIVHRRCSVRFRHGRTGIAAFRRFLRRQDWFTHMKRRDSLAIFLLCRKDS